MASNVSTRLQRLSSDMTEFEAGGLILDSDNVRRMVDQLRDLTRDARSLEREVDELRLVRGAELSDRVRAMGSAIAAARRHANVVVFPGVRIGIDG